MERTAGVTRELARILLPIVALFLYAFAALHSEPEALGSGSRASVELSTPLSTDCVD